MPHKTPTILKISVLALAVSFTFDASTAFAQWTPPTVPPPNGNVSAPINTSTSTQTKTGGLLSVFNLWVDQTLSVIGGIATGGANIEHTAYGTGNRYSYIDFHGDDTYTDYGLRLLRGNSGPNSDSWLQNHGTGTLNIDAQDAGSVALRTNGADRLFVNSTGNVGIGTAAPGAKLDVSQTTAGAIGSRIIMPTAAENTAPGIRVYGYSPAIELMDKDNAQNWYMGIDDNDANKLLFGRGYGPGQGVAPSIVIDTTGNVGIGTTAPNAKLQAGTSPNYIGLEPRTDGMAIGGINAANAARVGGFYSTNPVPGAAIHFGAQGAGGQRGAIAFLTKVADDNTTQPSANMVIDQNGNVGIGTTAPAAKLEVNGDALVNGITVGRGSQNVNTNTAVGANALYQQQNAGNTAVGNSAGDSYGWGSNTNSVFIGNNAQAVQTSAGNALTNLVVIGSSVQATKSNQVVLGNSSIVETLLRGKVVIGGESSYWETANKLTVNGSIATLQGTIGDGVVYCDSSSYFNGASGLYCYYPRVTYRPDNTTWVDYPIAVDILNAVPSMNVVCAALGRRSSLNFGSGSYGSINETAGYLYNGEWITITTAPTISMANC